MDEEQRAELLETLAQVERRYASLLAQYTGSTEEMARRVLAEAPLRQLFGEAQGLARRFAKFTIHHVAREENRRADVLANQAIDEASKEVR